MADNSIGGWRYFVEGITPNRAPDLPQDEFARASLERHKREGMLLAVRARWFALVVVAVMLPIVNFRFEMIYYEVLLILSLIHI